MVHVNAHHMATEIEAIELAIAGINAAGREVVAIKQLARTMATLPRPEDQAAAQ